MNGKSSVKHPINSSSNNGARNEFRGSRPIEDPLIKLQRSAGNHAVARLMRSLSGPQPKPTETREESEGRLQAEAEGDTGLQVSQRMQSHIEGLRSSGQPMPESVRDYFEPRLEHDFSDVRLHKDSQAAKAASDINARAFTVGKNIFFGLSQYSPETDSGKALIAHELTHVIRQHQRTKSWFLQRQAGTDYGLKLATSRNKYVTEAVNLWRGSKSMKIEDFADALMQEIKADLLSQGVPDLKWQMVPGNGLAGAFDQKKWLVEIDPAAFSQNTVKTLGDLSPDEVQEAAGTLYHESRHAQQDVLVIRALLQQNKTVKDIVKVGQYPQQIVEKVEKTKFSTPLDKDKSEHADRMFAVMYGEHNELISFLMDSQRSSTAVMRSLEDAADSQDLQNAEPTVREWEKWAKGVLQPKLQKLRSTKAAQPFEKQILRDLDALNRETMALVGAFDSAAKKTTPATLSKLKSHEKSWLRVFLQAYQNLESEKDAFAVEALVKHDLKTQMMAKPRKSP